MKQRERTTGQSRENVTLYVMKTTESLFVSLRSVACPSDWITFVQLVVCLMMVLNSENITTVLFNVILMAAIVDSTAVLQLAVEQSFMGYDSAVLDSG